MAGITRRQLTRGLAWSAPAIVIVQSAPAFAASTTVACSTLTSTQKGVANYPASGWTVTPASAGVTLSSSTPKWYKSDGTASTSYAPASDPTYSVLKSDSVATKAIGDIAAYNGSNFFRVSMKNGTPLGTYQTVTLTFSTPVYGLSFYLTDIDYVAGSYQDQVSLSSTTDGTTIGAAPTVTKPTGAGLNQTDWGIPAVTSSVSGSGTTASPWTNSSSYGNIDTGSAQGDLFIAYSTTQAVKTITFTYKAGIAATSDQQFFVSPMSYNTVPCTG